jgi:hypothetical protein
MVHVSCEDYRAAATIHLVHDVADLERSKLLDAGHFLAEERPEEIAQELLCFSKARRYLQISEPLLTHPTLGRLHEVA